MLAVVRSLEAELERERVLRAKLGCAYTDLAARHEVAASTQRAHDDHAARRAGVLSHEQQSSIDALTAQVERVHKEAPSRGFTTALAGTTGKEPRAQLLRLLVREMHQKRKGER